ncbi:glycosyltransferase family 1 protein [Sphingomonas sp. CROZ-RG-20F-R02-07]|uniref:glycosyltransferase family 4 protein n=1 Tax=Sphingomonas sp. CROZ-RG-20F-R02-07 TaxID=2914832 RepID=UPI001F59AD0D|nr:glycosyltransferase family 1 protein [Sphingomonas sp. CROZ-RG-20F-R02-07]
MLAAEGTGVATYARALRAAQQSLSSQALLLSGGEASAPDSPQSRIDRWRRSLRAALPLGTWARQDAVRFIRHDLFRLGQAFFTAQGRLLPVHVPGPVGIMHWSYPVPLRVVGWRNLYTIHDAIPLVRPELSPIDGKRHRKLLRQVALHADAIVTVSRSAAKEIVETLNLSQADVIDCSQPVAVVKPGSPTLLPAGLEAGGYLLVCGSVEPRKNVERIAMAYRASGTSLPLVIVGPNGWHSEGIAPALQDSPGIVRLSYQSRDTVIALITHARALLMPSLAEGFGLPVAEAMTLGTPVVTSATGALAETAGTAALLVDPLDVEAIAVAISTIARDDGLCDKLAMAGRDRARLFDPACFAERLRVLYDRSGSDG